MKVSLVKELRRVFNASEGMVLLAMHYGQITVDGYVVFPHHDKAWSRKQLSGRLAKLHFREARLFGASCRSYNNRTSVVATPTDVVGVRHDGDI